MSASSFPQPASAPAAGVPALTVVLPLFNEAPVLAELHRRVTDACAATGLPYEVLFVNDGSTDDTAVRLADLAARDPHVSVVGLSRNFGHPAAFTAGLDLAAGESVIVLDADLQDDPAVIGELLRVRAAATAEVVYVVRGRRAEGPGHRLLVTLFNRLLCGTARHAIPGNAGNYSLLGPRALAALRALPERSRYFPGLRAFVGFRQVAVQVDRQRRYDARSRMGFRGLLRLAAQALYGHTALPQIAIGLLAAAALLAAGVLGLYRAACALLALSPAAGSGLAAWGALGTGLVLSAQAVLCGQLARVHAEVQGRPLYVVADLRRGGGIRPPSA